MMYVVIGVVGLLVLAIVLKAVKNAADDEAARLEAKEEAEAAEAEKRRRQEEAKKRIEEENYRRAIYKLDAVRAANEREATIQAAIQRVPGFEKYRVASRPEEVTSSLLGITAFTPISKKQFVAFDTETTGLSDDSDAIVEIAAVRVVNGVIVEEFSQLIDPERSMPAAASAVNHITDDMLKGMPKIYEVLPAFLAFVGDDVLAAHNAPFDARFLAQACMRYRFAQPTRYFDTMNLARYYPDATNKKLGTLLACAGIKNDEAHRALGDARAVARLILHTNEIRKKK